MMNSVKHTSEYGHLYLIGDSEKKCSKQLKNNGNPIPSIESIHDEWYHCIENRTLTEKEYWKNTTSAVVMM